MSGSVDIRDSVTGDLDALETLYRDVFPEEDLVPLVRELMSPGAAGFSLVGSASGEIAAHISFTMCTISERPDTAALLGPLAVAESVRKRGVARALIETGLTRLRAGGAACVLVLGDPAFYSMFGFDPEAGISTPYPLPDAWRGAWQSKSLRPMSAVPAGDLVVPPPWRNPALWTA